MIRVVFDTVVFVRSLIDPYSFCGRIVFEHFQKYRLFLSKPVVEEILEVLRRDEVTSKFRTLAGFDLTKVLDILSAAEVVEAPVVGAVSRDPKDDKFLGTADAARAEYLVSEDEDLLVLGRYARATIVNCEEFLGILTRIR